MGKEKKRIKEDKHVCDVTVVLDESGSMQSLQLETIKSLNTFVKDQRKNKGTTKLSLVKFNTAFNWIYEAVSILKVREMTTANYTPFGYTALLDAVGDAIKKAEARTTKKDKVVLLIMTDGEENSSKEYSKSQIKTMIESKKDWQFVFIGANQDAFAEAGALGIGRAQTMSFAPSAAGTQAAMASLSGNLRAYTNGQASSMAFTSQDYKAQANLGIKNKK